MFFKRCFGATRSNKWRKVRRKFIKRNNFCAICSRKKKLEVHHIRPFHLYPELELKKSNLITLCRTCHFIFGHLFNYRDYNLNLIKDVWIWRQRIIMN